LKYLYKLLIYIYFHHIFRNHLFAVKGNKGPAFAFFTIKMKTSGK